MKKLLVILSLLFSSVFGDCLESYKKVYYYQGVYAFIAITEAYAQDLVDISKMNDDQIFYASNDLIIEIAKEENYTKALNYIQNINKRKKNIDVAKKEFFRGYDVTPKMIQNVEHQYGLNVKEAMYNIRRMADKVIDNGLRELNNCYYN